jgi:hypothetical protein
VLGLESLKAVTLRGILGIPLSVLEKAQNLNFLSLSRSSACFDDVLPVIPSTPQTCLDLWRTKDIAGGQELARYFGVRDTIMSSNLLLSLKIFIRLQRSIPEKHVDL